MTDLVKLSDLQIAGLRRRASREDRASRGTSGPRHAKNAGPVAPNTYNGVVSFGDGALEPVIQSALGIVRESAGLLYHIAGFGLALLSGPKISRPRGDIRQVRPTPQTRGSVVVFLERKRQVIGRNGNES